jgi:hypothetical protein
VTLEYSHGDPVFVGSNEPSNKISVDYCEYPGMFERERPDAYFTAIRKIVAMRRLKSEWGLVPFHSPRVTLTITLNGQAHRLVASREEHRLIFPDGRKAVDRQHIEAMKEIMKLTLDHVQSRYRVD